MNSLELSQSFIYRFRSIEASTVVFNCFSEPEHPKKMTMMQCLKCQRIGANLVAKLTTSVTFGDKPRDIDVCKFSVLCLAAKKTFGLSK